MLVLISASALFSLAIVNTVPTAMAADAKPRTLYCEEGVKTSSGSMQTKLTVDLPINEIIGGIVTTYAVLTDSDGSPIVAAPILFYVNSGNVPPVWVGHAITDCDGVAILRFTRQETGQLVITAKFEGGTRLSPNEITAALELKRLAPKEPEIVTLGAMGVTTFLGVIVAVAMLGAVVAAREDKKDTDLSK